MSESVEKGPALGLEAVAEGGPEDTGAGEAALAPAGGTIEAIEVHGHWTIEVRDPDGSLVERREFDNALYGSGSLEEILDRAITIGGWEIEVTAEEGGYEVCEEPAGTPNENCFIAEATSTTPGNNVFKTLAVSFSTGTNFTLSGSLVAQRDGAFAGVFTKYAYCASSVAPDSCPGGAVAGVHGFTNTDLSPTIFVSTGQQVLVTVVISFF